MGCALELLVTLKPHVASGLLKLSGLNTLERRLRGDSTKTGLSPRRRLSPRGLMTWARRRSRRSWLRLKNIAPLSELLFTLRFQTHQEKAAFMGPLKKDR